MTIGLANSSLKSRYIGSIVNRNQGGGDKKFGNFPAVGKTQWTNIFYNNVNPVTGHCATVPCLNKTLVFPNLSRPVGSWTNANVYWHIPGTGNTNDRRSGY